LKSVGKHLRAQAGTYLEKNLMDGDVMAAVIEGIASHLAVALKKIKEEELIIPILLTDIEQLKKANKTEDIQKQLKDKIQHLETTRASIAFQKANLPSEDNLQQYIDITKQDHIYCGIAQLFALGRFYGIPVRVVYNYGKAESSQLFNDKVNNSNG